MKRNRIDWIDVLRGIGIIIMVMGHIGFGGKFDRVIHAYHMPMFFMISGFLHRSKRAPLGKTLLHKSGTLLLPYVSFFVINYAVWLFVMRKDKDPLTPIFAGLGYNTHDMPIAGALWFLTALFFAEVLFLLGERWIPGEGLRSGIFLTVAVGSSVVTTFTEFRLPLALDQAFVGLGFYQIGHFTASKLEAAKWSADRLSAKSCICWGAGALAVNLVLAFLNGYVNMKDASYAIIPLSWLNAVIGVLGWVLFAVLIAKKTRFLKKLLTSIGQNSIVYLGMNQMVIRLLLLTPIAVIGSTGAVTFANAMGSILILIVTLVVLYGISALFTKTGLRLLIGKQNLRSGRTEGSLQTKRDAKHH